MDQTIFSWRERDAFLDSCHCRRNQVAESHFQGISPAHYRGRYLDFVLGGGALLQWRIIRSNGFNIQHSEFVVPIRFPETTEDECFAKIQGCVA